MVSVHHTCGSRAPAPTPIGKLASSARGLSCPLLCHAKELHHVCPQGRGAWKSHQLPSGHCVDLSLPPPPGAYGKTGGFSHPVWKDAYPSRWPLLVFVVPLGSPLTRVLHPLCLFPSIPNWNSCTAACVPSDHSLYGYLHEEIFPT